MTECQLHELFLTDCRISLLACLSSSLDHGNRGIKVSTVGEEADLGTWSNTEEGRPQS